MVHFHAKQAFHGRHCHHGRHSLQGRHCHHGRHTVIINNYDYYNITAICAILYLNKLHSRT